MTLGALLVLPACTQPPAVTSIHDTPAHATIVEAIGEVEHALDLFFGIMDEQSALKLVKATQHAARARLLLEQVLQEDTDNFDFSLVSSDPYKHTLILISNQINKFTGQAAADLWIRDLSTPHYGDATMELATLDVLVTGLKRTFEVG